MISLLGPSVVPGPRVELAPRTNSRRVPGISTRRVRGRCFSGYSTTRDTHTRLSVKENTVIKANKHKHRGLEVFLEKAVLNRRKPLAFYQCTPAIHVPTPGQTPRAPKRFIQSGGSSPACLQRTLHSGHHTMAPQRRTNQKQPTLTAWNVR